ncbi:MAG: energy transducer TonB, partial [Myxococcota bacterium]
MVQPHSQPTSGRPGRMTAVMRAVSQESGPKILRIALVQEKQVVDERLIKKRTSVTIGPSEKATFVVPTRKIPPNFALFELIGDSYHLNSLEGMKGKLSLKTGVSDLDQLQALANKVSIGGTKVFRVRLDEDARGKVVVGDTTFLFQFVVRPPEPPKAQLPVSVRKGFAGDIDWFTTIVASFSFLLHFMLVLMAYAYDPPADEGSYIADLVERAESIPPPPDLEKPKAEAEDESAKKDDKKDEAKQAKKQVPQKGKSTAKGKTADKGASKSPAPDSKAAADAKAAEIAAELSQLNIDTMTSLQDGGPATAAVFEGDSAPIDALDNVAASSKGVGSNGDPLNTGGSGNATVTPGQGGSTSLAQRGNTGSAGSDAKATSKGNTTKVEGPKGTASASGGAVAGTVSNASAVVARMRGRFRRCYQQGLASNPDMQGAATLTANIGPNGE